jgi:histidinol-phosphate aminotransferase
MNAGLDRFIKQWVWDIEPYVPGEMREGFIKLASNENNYGPSPRVAEALKDCIECVNIYPYKDSELREGLAGYCDVGEENIVAGNGSDELIDLVLKAFKGPVLCVYPSFSEYRLCSQIMGERYSEVNLDEDFSFPLERFKEKAVDYNILFLCNPNNPTGSVLGEEDIVEILELGKITVVDEAYYEFYGETIAPLLESYSNLIVFRTLSKAFALGGLRVGYAISNPGVIDLISRVKQPFNVNSLSQVAAISALKDLSYMRNSVKEIIEDRGVLYSSLSRGFKAFRSEANFVLVDTTPLKSREFYERLLKERIIVRDLGEFKGFNGEYCRISVGTTEENRKLIQALKEF